MTNLGCNAKSCNYNKDCCCCLSSIQVAGHDACTCDNTCCSSYSDSKDTATNTIKSPKLSLSIACEADNCIYNADKHCNADHVDISGISATDSEDTVCATFTCK